ncbi:hypothetical protein D3C76_1452980 [compost metagenome]
MSLAGEIPRWQVGGLLRQALDRLHRQRAVGGNAFGQVQGRRQQALAGQQIADQADAQGFLGTDRYTRQGDFHRMGRGNCPK